MNLGDEYSIIDPEIMLPTLSEIILIIIIVAIVFGFAKLTDIANAVWEMRGRRQDNLETGR